MLGVPGPCLPVCVGQGSLEQLLWGQRVAQRVLLGRDWARTLANACQSSGAQDQRSAVTELPSTTHHLATNLDLIAQDNVILQGTRHRGSQQREAGPIHHTCEARARPRGGASSQVEGPGLLGGLGRTRRLSCPGPPGLEPSGLGFPSPKTQGLGPFPRRPWGLGALPCSTDSSLWAAGGWSRLACQAAGHPEGHAVSAVWTGADPGRPLRPVHSGEEQAWGLPGGKWRISVPQHSGPVLCHTVLGIRAPKTPNLRHADTPISSPSQPCQPLPPTTSLDMCPPPRSPKVWAWIPSCPRPPGHSQAAGGQLAGGPGRAQLRRQPGRGQRKSTQTGAPGSGGRGDGDGTGRGPPRQST